MAQETSITGTTLIIRKTIAGPRLRVFQAWTSPDLIKKWFAPNEAFLVPEAAVDLRVGGRYRIAMRPPDRETLHVATGVYREIKAPEKLVFTWSWEGEPGETLVTVEFRDHGDETEIMLKHERFADAATRDKHSEGWTGCLGQLAARIPAL